MNEHPDCGLTLAHAMRDNDSRPETVTCRVCKETRAAMMFYWRKDTGRPVRECRVCRRHRLNKRQFARLTLPANPPHELAYLAGIIDGEGTIHMAVARDRSRDSRHTWRVMLSIANTDEALMKWIQARFGGKYYLREPRQNSAHKRVFRWVRARWDSLGILTAVLPYLVVKRRQANIALTFYQRLEVYRDTVMGDIPRPLPAEFLHMAEEMTTLNRRGTVA